MNLMLVAAVIIITLGHFFRVKRWKSLISVYEDVSDSTLMSYMSFGYMANMLLPFRLGDILRAVLCGKKLKNKTVFALSTIIIDRLLDVFFVALIYLWFYIFENRQCLKELLFYSVLSFILFIGMFWAICFRKSLKTTMLFFSSIFNEKIQLWLLSLVWACIYTIKNILHRINKPHLIIRTALMWLCYMCSYCLFGLSSNRTTLEVVNDMFYPGGILPIEHYYNDIKTSTSLITSHFSFDFLSCLMLFFLGLFFSLFVKFSYKQQTEFIIPYTNPNSRLDFLRIYFSSVHDSSYINSFLNINKDVTILRNLSAGSNATTILCIKDNNIIYRKYAFDSDADKLFKQTEWLRKNRQDLSLTDILAVNRLEKVCSYDMPHINNAIGFFDYIHSSPDERSWEILSSVLADMSTHYEKTRFADADDTTIREYVQKKVINNLNLITASPALRHLLAHKTLVINGVEYMNLSSFISKLHNMDFWLEIFKSDYYSDIHGDLTIENIICSPSFPKGYYLIDPNNENIHNSPGLDFGKLLQSLHGSYEFLMHSQKATINKNTISYNITRSSSYDNIYKQLRRCVIDNYDPSFVKSMYFHEIVHWLRLMPYKINNDAERAPVFYAGMIIVINNIFKEFIDND